MRKFFAPLLVFIFCLTGISACTNEESKTAMLDVNTIITSGAHAQQAGQHMAKAQEIYQYNLTVIEKKLSAYENKAQAQAYLVEAARQLQAQLNNSKTLVTQALLNTLNAVVNEQKQVYDLIVQKSGILYVNEGTGGVADKFKAMPEDITSKVQALYDRAEVTLPPLPNIVETPNLPDDLGADAPFPPVEKKEDTNTDADAER